MKLLVQADGIQLDPANSVEWNLLDKMCNGCKVYPIGAVLNDGRGTSFRLVVREKESKEADDDK